jgi:hypothetical protein
MEGVSRHFNTVILNYRLPSRLVLSAPQSIGSFVTYNMTIFLINL